MLYALKNILAYNGFKNHIPDEKIGHISNLQMLPWMENQLKGWK